MERKQRERTMTGRRRTTWARLLILAGATGLGELGLDALELGFGVVEADELLEGGVHGREEGNGGTVEGHSTPAEGGAGVWAWKDSNLRLAGYEPAVLTS